MNDKISAVEEIRAMLARFREQIGSMSLCLAATLAAR
jgi:hypothetical protein